MKLRLLAVTLAAMTLSGTVLAQAAKPPAKPASPSAAAAPAGDRATLSYAFGYQLGAELARSGETFDTSTVVKGLQDAYAKREPTYTAAQMEASYKAFQARIRTKMEGEFQKARAENKTRSPAFLTEYKAKQGVVSLPSGVMYRVVEPGAGAKANAASQVTIAFQSLLAPVGVPITGSEGTPVFKVSESPVVGLRELLPLMQQGAVIEAVFPPGKYFTGPGADDLAGQAILMQVKLLSVK